MPSPKKPLSPCPSTEIHWEEPPEDGNTDYDLTETFNRIINKYARKMLSDLLNEHQVACFAQQKEIDSLREQLLKYSGVPNLETSCAPPVVDLSTMAKRNSPPVRNPASKSKSKGPSASSYTKVDIATSFQTMTSSGALWIPNHKSHEPEKHAPCREKLRRLVQSDKFEMLSAVIILANVIVMTFQVQYEGLDIGHRIRLETYSHPANKVWPGADIIFSILDAAFNVIFSLELLIRLAGNGCSSFVMPWMWFDTIVVSMGLLDFLSSGILIGVDATIVRLVRLVRLTRLLKIFNAMVAFDSLFLLLKSIKASMNALFWSFLLLIAVQIGVALLLIQMLHPSMTDSSLEPTTRERLFYYFGTFPKGMMTMFEITLANWVPVCRFLIDEVHDTFIIIFLVYRCIFCFAVLRVIAAVFITETNRVLTNDAELTLMKAQREKAGFKSKFLHLLHDIDGDNDGKITWAEMQRFLMNPALTDWLSTIGLTRTDFEKLFWLLEVDQGVDINKFLTMIGDLKGHAKTVDLLNVFKFMHAMHDDIHKGLQLDDDEEETRELQALEMLQEGADLVDDGAVLDNVPVKVQ